VGVAEHALSQIWSEVLGVERVGRWDNFFELGGHSLLATRVMMRVIDDFATEISLRRFFEAPTLAELAREIEAARADSQRPRQSGIVRQTRTMVAIPDEAE
jgi:acyl carrier protein